MNEEDSRLRQHPHNRFLAPQHLIDLDEVANQLLAEPLEGPRKHRQKTLYKHGSTTVALFLFERGAQLPPHVAEGVVTVHVLQGRLRMSAEEHDHDLAAGQLLVMAPGVKHDVLAQEPTRMLLTVCLDESADRL